MSCVIRLVCFPQAAHIDSDRLSDVFDKIVHQRDQNFFPDAEQSRSVRDHQHVMRAGADYFRDDAEIGAVERVDFLLQNVLIHNVWRIRLAGDLRFLPAQGFRCGQRGDFPERQQDMRFVPARRDRSIFLAADKNFLNFGEIKIRIQAMEF